MAKLSILVPFCVEWPQVAFTLRSIMEELNGRASFEVIAVDNWCDEVKAQGAEQDRGSEMVKSMADINNNLVYLHYKDKLSHWNAKRMGIAHATGDIYCFIDAHCIVGRNALFDAFTYYADNWEELNGTLHLPLTYHILEEKRLMYKLKYTPENFDMHYSFTGYPNNQNDVIEVPCMSTCGMMIHKNIYEETGGWPEQLGIYGGGENFMNFVLSILGKRKFVYNTPTALYHHGEKRKYSFNWEDFTRNRAIATYMFGGITMADGYIRRVGSTGRYLNSTLNFLLENCQNQHDMLRAKQVIGIEEWASKWID